MTLSPAGLAFLKRAEGFRSTIYPDADGWAIGFGCSVNPSQWLGQEITEPAADALLRMRVREFERAVDQSVTVPLEQHQYDACVCLAFNIGSNGFRTSTLVQLLNNGLYGPAAEQFLRWRFSEHKPSKELLARRKLERAMFLGQKVEA